MWQLVLDTLLQCLLMLQAWKPSTQTQNKYLFNSCLYYLNSQAALPHPCSAFKATWCWSENQNFNPQNICQSMFSFFLEPKQMHFMEPEAIYIIVRNIGFILIKALLKAAQCVSVTQYWRCWDKIVKDDITPHISQFNISCLLWSIITNNSASYLNYVHRLH